jgi:hypothetical protein
MATPSLWANTKVDLGLVGQTLNNAAATGPYFAMAGYRRAMAICTDGASAVNKSTQLEWMQATAAAGTGAKVVKSQNVSTGTESKALTTAAATAITKVTECTLTMATMLNTETVIINGLTFTAHTDTTTVATRTFKIDGTDTADAAALAGVINDATYGVPGVTATAVDAVITLTSTNPGATPITVSTAAVTKCVPAITKQILYSEIDISDMDIAGGFVYAAPKVTKAGNGIVSVVVLREREPTLL